MDYFDIDMLHITKAGSVNLQQKPTTKQAFLSAINNLKDPTILSGLEACVIMVEDLSREVAETLGNLFDLDPVFFANHLRTTQNFEPGQYKTAKTLIMEPVPSYFKTAPFYAVEFRRPYYIPGELKEVIVRRKRETNTPRGCRWTRGVPNLPVDEMCSIYVLENHGFRTCTPPATLQLIHYRTCFSEHMTDITLTDALIEKNRPAGYVVDPALSSETAPTCPQLSCRSELQDYLLGLSPIEALALKSNPEPFALRPLLKLVAETASIFLADASFNLDRIVHRHFDAHFPSNRSFCFNVCRDSHRCLYDQQRVLRANITTLTLLVKPVPIQLSPSSSSGQSVAASVENPVVKELKLDLTHLLQEMDALLKRLEHDISFLTSSSSIQQAEAVTNFTIFAFLFVPISTIAGILGIDWDGGVRFIVFGVLTVPVLIGSLVAVWWWRRGKHDELQL